MIIVDDGSTDDTRAVSAARQGVTLIPMARNGCKTRALAAGIEKAGGDFLLLFDSDRIGLAQGDLTALLNGDADMRISLRRNAPRPWHWIGLDYISGERALLRDMVAEHLNALDRLPRFGFEVWLNARAVQDRARLTAVGWSQVDSPTKSRKAGLVKGVMMDALMIKDLARAVGPVALLRQIIAMRRMRVLSGSSPVGFGKFSR